MSPYGLAFWELGLCDSDLVLPAATLCSAHGQLDNSDRRFEARKAAFLPVAMGGASRVYGVNVPDGVGVVAVESAILRVAAQL